MAERFLDRGESDAPSLAGAINLRDMGGYPAADGQRVRLGRLYRSGSTHALTAADLAALAHRGVRYVHDFRSNSERKLYPSPWSGTADVRYWYKDHDVLPGDLRRVIRQQPHLPPGPARNLMLQLYRDLPYQLRESYRALFENLANGHVPVIFHCTAGKDRTGVAAALLLTALGVAREAIQADYLLSPQFLAGHRDLLLQNGRELLDKLPPASLDILMGCDGDYLNAMFAQLELTHGSAENYLITELHVTAEMLGALRGTLLEPASPIDGPPASIPDPS